MTDKIQFKDRLRRMAELKSALRAAFPDLPPVEVALSGAFAGRTETPSPKEIVDWVVEYEKLVKDHKSKALEWAESYMTERGWND